MLSSPRSAETANSCVIRSSSRNADSISSDRTTKLLPLSRCASTIHIVRPSESTAETQPKLHPCLLRLSAISYQCRFTELIVRVRRKNIWEPPSPVPVEFNVNSTWPEYVLLDTGASFTRGGSTNAAVPAADSENGREQRQWGKEPMRRAGSRPCANCGKGFEPSVHSSHNQKYCSYRCKKEAWKVKRKTMPLRAASADHVLHPVT